MKQQTPFEFSLSVNETVPDLEKSLSPNSLESYFLPVQSPDRVLHAKMDQFMPQLSGKHIAQSPNILKINESLFCILLSHTITFFRFLGPEERMRTKTKNSFCFVTPPVTLPADSVYMVSNHRDLVFIANNNQILALQVQVREAQDESSLNHIEVLERNCINVPNIHGIQVSQDRHGEYLLVMATQSVLKCTNFLTIDLLADGQILNEKIELVVNFDGQGTGFENLSTLEGIGIIFQGQHTFYYFGHSIQSQTIAKAKLPQSTGTQAQPEITQQYEVLYIVKYELREQTVSAKIFIIDHIFELDIFKRSRVYGIGHQTFELSLFQEVIFIRRNFQNFVVWDNLSIVNSKNNEKRGQLALTSPNLMIYTEAGEIYVHQLNFIDKKAKLEAPRIDCFKGNDNAEEVLYDALSLNCHFKIVFYFRFYQIGWPRSSVLNDVSMPRSENLNGIRFKILVIEQAEPTCKLKELLTMNKEPEYLLKFIHRFGIDELTLAKCRWEVSAKQQKDIETILLDIQDNDYIQDQLSNILKEKPRDLQFLLTVQKKQIARYRRLLATKLLKLKRTNVSSRQRRDHSTIIKEDFSKAQIEQIKLILSWMLEAEMFVKKLNYSQNCLSFQEYGFREIGKLKATALRSNIKLLCCRGLKRRLKYFLNSFKYLILDDFKVMLRFVLEDLSQEELEVYLTQSFPFLMPRYEQSGDEPCQLWVDTFHSDTEKITTPDSIQKQLQKEIDKLVEFHQQNSTRISSQEAIAKFASIFSEFVTEEWFVNNCYKQHCLLKNTVQSLKESFYDLKKEGVCRIITEQMFQNIENGRFAEKTTMKVIQSMTTKGVFEQQFTSNISARINTYALISNISIRDFEYKLPIRSQFLIMPEKQYFQFIFHFHQKQIITKIKPVYDQVNENLFVSRFRMFLASDSPTLEQLIDFLSSFIGQQNHYETVRLELFQAICSRLKISDTQNTDRFICQLMQQSVLCKQEISLDKPRESAAVVLINYFLKLFNRFQIDCTFDDLLKQTTIPVIEHCPVLNRLICDYILTVDPTKEDVIQFPISNYFSKINNVDISETVDFFALLLYYQSTLNIEVTNLQILTKIIQCLFFTKRYSILQNFLNDLLHKKSVNEYSQYFYADNNPINQLLHSFKLSNNIKQFLQGIVLKWVWNKYKSICKHVNINQQHNSQLQIQQKIDKKQQSTQKIPYQTIQNEIFGHMQQTDYHRDQLKSLFDNLPHEINVIESQDIYIHDKYQQISQTKQHSEQLTALIVMDKQQSKLQVTQISIASLLLEVSSALSILNKYNTNQKIQCEIAFLSLVQNLKILDFNTMLFVLKSAVQQDSIFGQQNGFQFMMSILSNTNKQIFNLQEYKQIDTQIKLLVKIYSDYQMSQKTHKVRSMETDYCRFQAELIVVLVDQSLFLPAMYNLFELMETDYYYRDVFFYLLARIVTPGVKDKDMEKVVDQFMTVDSASSLKRIIDKFIMEHQIDQFVQSSLQRENAMKIFECLLKESQFDEAFAMLIRNQQVSLLQMVQRSDKLITVQNDNFYACALVAHYVRMLKKYMSCLHYPSFMTYQSKSASLCNNYERMDLIKSIYIVIDELELAVLKAKPKQTDQLKQSSNSVIYRTMSADCEQLKAHYRNYMQSQGLDPKMKMQLSQDPTCRKIQYFASKTPLKAQNSSHVSRMLEPEKGMLNEERQKLFENEKRLREIKEENNALMEQKITPLISQARQDIDNGKKLSLLQRKEMKLGTGPLYEIQSKIKEEKQQLNRLFQEENQKIDALKEKYESKTVLKALEIMEELRKRRQQIKEETAVTTIPPAPPAPTAPTAPVVTVIPAPDHQPRERNISMFTSAINLRPRRYNLNESKKSTNSGEEEEKSNFLATNSMILKDRGASGVYDLNRSAKESLMKQPLGRVSRFEDLRLNPKSNPLKRSKINELFNDSKGEYYIPRREIRPPTSMISEQSRQDSKRKKMSMKSSLFSDNKSSRTSKDKLSFSQIGSKASNLDPGISELLKKMQHVQKSPKFCADIMKRVYESTAQMQNYLVLCHDLLNNIDNAKEYIEQKSLRIVEQASKIHLSLKLKQVFPAEFFTKPYDSSLRDYYPVAFEIIKPRVVNFLENHEDKANMLAVSIRFGFGYDLTYYYKVYEQCMRVMLRKYEKQQNCNEKKMTAISQKIKQNFKCLNPENRKIKLSQFFMEIKDRLKRHNLIKQILNDIGNMNSLSPPQSLIEIKSALESLR